MRAADVPGEKALVIITTLFCEADHRPDWELPMSRIIADWGLRYPGAKNVEPVYFYEVAIAETPNPQEPGLARTSSARSSPSRAPTLRLRASRQWRDTSVHGQERQAQQTAAPFAGRLSNARSAAACARCWFPCEG
jgi:hypothetical protein